MKQLSVDIIVLVSVSRITSTTLQSTSVIGCCITVIKTISCDINWSYDISWEIAQ